MLGLNVAKDYGIQLLHVIGDSDLVVCQVKGTFSCNKMRLKRYRDVVIISTKDFQSISLEAVPGEHNKATDALAFFASIFDPDNEVQDTCKVQVIFCPFMPDNFDNWEVFYDDKQICIFMANVDEYAGNQID